MENRRLLIGAIVLLALGAAGLAAVALTATPLPSGSPAGFSSNGQRIYYTAADAHGAIPLSVAGGGVMGFGMMGGAACVGCHGEDGRGGRIAMVYATVAIPDIRYSALTGSRTESGTVVPGWTDADIARAIRDGVEPNGQQLLAPMPRWNMTDSDLADVIAYLKELDKR